MNLTALRNYITGTIEKFVKADRIINGLTAKNVQLEAKLSTANDERDKYKALSEAQAADNAEEASVLEEAIAKLSEVTYPEVTPEEEQGAEENDPENPQQMEDEAVQVVIDVPETSMTPDDAPTVGTPEETPTDVVDAAIESVIRAVSADEELATEATAA